MKKIIVLLGVLLVFTLSACSKKELLIVTTTSLDNSGLLDYILPVFEEEYGIFVKVVALGTGAALEMGEMGEADILLVHAYDREIEFVNNGYGEKRHNIMYNDFIIVGPFDLEGDTLADALEFMTSQELDFYSRGDNSGTHQKELSIWNQYNYDVTTFGNWYHETGQGMGATLTMASLSGYYTLSDRATYLSMKDNLDLIIAYENREELKNQYGVIKVNPDLHNRNEEYADLFYDWIISQDTQDLIATYIMYDEQLFYPNAGD